MKYIATICLLLATVFASAVYAQPNNPGPPGCDGPPGGGGPPDCIDPPGDDDPSEGGGPPEGFGPPEFVGMHIPDNAGPPNFVTLLHCGCNEQATLMEFVEIVVTSRSRGHLQHDVGSVDSCAPPDSDVHLDFIRLMADCQIVAEGDELLGDPIAACTNQVAGQVCGELAPPPSGG